MKRRPLQLEVVCVSSGQRELFKLTIDFACRMQDGFVHDLWTPDESGAIFQGKESGRNWKKGLYPTLELIIPHTSTRANHRGKEDAMFEILLGEMVNFSAFWGSGG